jgi:hypothetical protein
MREMKYKVKYLFIYFACFLGANIIVFLPSCEVLSQTYQDSSNVQNLNEEYVNSYKICSSAAEQLTKKQCNYGQIYEGYYLQCMQIQGFEGNTPDNPDYYENYIAAYNYCSSISVQNTEHYCNYGSNYNINYNKCMTSYGFNEQGKKTGNADAKEYFDFDF